jgi:polyhydroxybutyrate depolymerase
MNYSKMNDLADTHGFMVCYPQGTINENTGQTHWNANLTFSTIDDIGFLSELVVTIQEEFNTNPEHTFVAGMSNGGFMSYTLACERSDLFKGIASITGTMSGYDWNNCNPQMGLSVMQMSGTQDRVVPWDGSMSTQGGWGGAPHILEVIDLWAEVNECTLTETVDFPNIVTTDNSTASLYKYTTEFDNRQVWFYQIDGGGHQWPGWGGSGNQDIKASEEIWKFFQRLMS